MDLEDLENLAVYYGVHPAALLFPPSDNGATAQRMQVASTLIERMPHDAAEEWLRLGERLVRSKTEN